MYQHAVSDNGLFLKYRLLHRTHDQQAPAVEDQAPDHECGEEQHDMRCKCFRVDAGAGEIREPYVVQDLRRVRMDHDQHEQHGGQRDQEAEQVSQDRGQRRDCQQRDHCQDQSHKAAHFHGNEPVFDIPLHSEQHDIADKDQPAVLKMDHM